MSKCLICNSLIEPFMSFGKMPIANGFLEPSHKKTMDFLMGDLQPAQILKIPPGVAHGCKTVQGPVNLFYATSHIYNPNDEIRMPYNDPEIDFDWMAGPPIK